MYERKSETGRRKTSFDNALENLTNYHSAVNIIYVSVNALRTT